ncbi:bifunctional tetrahydrofolate synthase/dihydrofolate synthase [Rodentibacter caecimuris]|uniref:Dihydrofolate synthase/folylpolyglutamate synthase n=1 Tax=Rodentibacter caecimuris TaxID=1796644 RepID=A0ABX3KX81_9PAST|nr:bifunctional folylpolyglutamate synthase/dihydrofolate synthase [Rodentibacter heylii]
MNNHTSHLTATSPLSEWLSYLENHHIKAIDLGLERVGFVAEKLNLLKPAPFVITVGGTNGKGSTCRFLEITLLNAGFKVGVYSSPHLLRYNERVRIQNQELSDEQHTASFFFIEQNKTESLTYFEFSTLSALHLFKQANLDIVILEVGLGGRLDATNIVDNDLAVITTIDIDHTDFLGETREKIAYEKAGIFRANKPVVIGDQNIPHTMMHQAQKLGCILSCRNIDWEFKIEQNYWQWRGKKIQLNNLPFCQIPLENAATALAAIELLPFDVSNEIIIKALKEVYLTGRFQTIQPEYLATFAKLLKLPVGDFPQIIIDVGHNPQAANYLAEKLISLKLQKQGSIIAVCGILKDKDEAGIFSPLLSVIDKWYCISLQGYRGQKGEELREKLLQLSPKTISERYHSILKGVESAVKNGNKNDIIIIFGSFYTVSSFLNSIENLD